MQNRTLNAGKSMRTKKKLALAMSAGTALIWVRGSGAANVPIAVTGWNWDVIAETNTPLESTTGPAFPSTSGVTKPAVLYYTGTGTGLPANNTAFVSASNSATTFQIPDYTANNSILLNSATTSTNANLTPYGDTGTLTLNTPASYNTLALLATSALIYGTTGNAPPATGLPVNYTITFTDSSTLPGTFTPLPYNSSSTAYALTNVSSGARTDPIASIVATRKLFESDISIPVPDQSKQIQSISFSGSTAYNGSADILAISGSGPAPILTWKGSVSNAWDTTSANWQGSSLYSDGDAVIFDDTAPSSATSISIANPVAPTSVQLNNNSNIYSFSGAGITGSGSLTMNSNNGTGVATLNNVNTYTGATTVNGGTLIVGPTGAVASKSIVVNSGGTFNVSSSGLLSNSSLALTVSGTANLAVSYLSVASLGGSGTLNLNGTALTINTGGFAGSINGTGQLILNGSVSLTGSNTYSGGTTLNSSASLALTSNNVGTGPLIFNGGSLSSGNSYTLPNGFTFGANANLSGNTGVTSGTPLTIAGPGTFPAGTNSISTLNLLAFSGPISGPGGLAVASRAAVYLTNPNNTFTGGVSVTGTSNVVDPNFALYSGQLFLDAGDAYTGPTLVTTNGILTVGAAGALGNTSGITVGTAGGISAEMIVSDNSGFAGLAGGVSGGAPLPLTLYGNGFGLFFDVTPVIPYGSLLGAPGINSTYAGPVTLGAGGAGIGVGNGGSFDITGVISSADSTPLPLGTNGGAASITLGNANTYTGDTQINAESYANSGTLTIKLGNNGGIPATSGVYFNSGQGSLDLGGYSPSVKFLVGTGLASVVNSGSSSSTLTINNGNTSSGPAVFGGPISGSIALNKIGSGNQTLTGANSYTNGTTLSGGKLTVTNSTGLGSGPVTLSGGTLVLNAGSGNVTGFSGMVLQGNATSNGSVLSIVPPANTLPGTTLLASAFNAVPSTVPGTAGGFTASFLYTPASGTSASTADGITFTIQNDPAGTAALGDPGYSLGYGANGETNGIQNSGSVMLNVNPANGPIGTAFGFDGITGSYTSSGSVNLASEPVQVNLQYNASAQTLTETLYGTVSQATYSNTFTSVDFSQLLSSSTAYVGFTASINYGTTDTQTISNFTFNNSNSFTPDSITNTISTTAGTSSVISASVSPGLNQLSLGSISIAANSKLALVNTGSGTMVVTIPQLSIAGSTNAWTGQLDLGTSALVVQSAGATGLATITNQIKGGYSAGSWNGSGITSTAAAAESTHLTALGVILNDLGGSSTGTPIYTTFEGAATSDGDVLVKYSYYGDANLDGRVDGSDYSRIDNGSLDHLTGWFNGDFNYDGVIDGSDYTLIDNAFNTQGANIAFETAGPSATVTAQIAGSSAVPEPATLGLVGMATVGLLGRRRQV